MNIGDLLTEITPFRLNILLIRLHYVRDQDFRTFPENLKGDLKLYFVEIRGTR